MFALSIFLIICGFLFGYFCTVPIHGYKTTKTQIIAGSFCSFYVFIFIGVIVWIYCIIKQELGIL